MRTGSWQGVRTPAVTVFCCGLGPFCVTHLTQRCVRCVTQKGTEATAKCCYSRGSSRGSSPSSTSRVHVWCLELWYRPAAPSSRRLTVTQRPRAPQGGLLCPRLPSASLLSSRASHQRTSSRSQPLHGRHLSSLDSPLPACPNHSTMVATARGGTRSPKPHSPQPQPRGRRARSRSPRLGRPAPPAPGSPPPTSTLARARVGHMPKAHSFLSHPTRDGVSLFVLAEVR